MPEKRTTPTQSRAATRGPFFRSFLTRPLRKDGSWSKRAVFQHSVQIEIGVRGKFSPLVTVASLRLSLD